MNENLDIPIVLIVYNRPDLTKLALNRIAQVNPKRVLVISDGPRADKKEDQELVRLTREVCNQENWDFSVSMDAAESNLGLRQRIISGLNWAFDQCEAAIILEDDCSPDPSFFTFVSEVLRHHSGSERLGIVSGNNFCGKTWESPYSYGFSTTARIWGWGTWSHVWKSFSEQDEIEFSWNDSQQTEIVDLITGKARKSAMKKMLKAGDTLDAWSLAFSVFLLRNKLLNIVPEKNLVENIGFGIRSTHTKFESFTAQIAATNIALPLRHPPDINHDEWIETSETREYWRVLLLYPLRHPLDVVGRLWRYLKIRSIS